MLLFYPITLLWYSELLLSVRHWEGHVKMLLALRIKDATLSNNVHSFRSMLEGLFLKVYNMGSVLANVIMP